MDSETRARRDACPHRLIDGQPSPAELLATIGTDVIADTYGEGGVVADLEQFVADLLGHQAAVFLPSGTMAQAATLRVHADARTSRTILWHSACHLARHEDGAYARLHGLVGRVVGDADRLITATDLEAIAEPAAGLLLELPQRDLGGQQPAWADLLAQLELARATGAALHLDGARLWESAAGYGRSPADVAGLFDTAYVSFYKGIGALPGCCVAGPSAVVAQVREWRKRLGGTLYGMWPAAASALALLPERLAEMPARLVHARAIAAALAGVEGVAVVPDPPQTPMLHLLLTVEADRYTANQRRLAEDLGIWAPEQTMPTADPRVRRTELSIGRTTCALEATAVADAIAALVA